MRTTHLLSFAAACLFLAACQQQTPETKAPDMRTIESVQGASLPVDAPPSLEDQAEPPTTTTGTQAAKNKTRAQQQEEALTRRMDLPFAPAIAMDPVDGAKVSITTATPMADYKNKIYYFSSIESRRVFLANSDAYVKGPLTRY
jgi:YHS domain.